MKDESVSAEQKPSTSQTFSNGAFDIVALAASAGGPKGLEPSAGRHQPAGQGYHQMPHHLRPAHGPE